MSTDKSILEKWLDVVSSARFVDMTHPLEEEMPYWPTHSPFIAVVGNHQSRGDESYWRTVTLGEHAGTHIDAFSHFIPGAQNVDEIPLPRLMGRGVNIDATDTPPRGEVPVEKILAFEREQGPVVEGDLVFFRFGWDEKWAPGERGKAFLENWPGTSKAAAEYLRDKKVAAVGCDTLALDRFGSPDNPSHHVLLGSGINIIENVDGLGVLPPFFGVMGLPCRLRGGSGSTLRLVALLEPACGPVREERP
ncbi:MAG: cyclase family protein [Fretibacterium sp.]|nr:cyclase family protein [Fretibacterium sp.]